MPKVIYNSTKGLVQSAGSGFSVVGFPIKPGVTAAATYTGAKYTLTARADAAADLDGKYFILYDRAGVSYAWWFDVDNSGTTEPAGAAAADNSNEITSVTTGMSANNVAAKLVLAINADIATKAFSIAASEVVSVYILTVGPMTTTTIDAGDSGFTLALTNSATSSALKSGLNSPMAQATVTAGTDIASVKTEIPLDDGVAAGQEKFVQVAVPSAGQIVFTGNFCNATTVGTKLTFNATTGAVNGLYMVWNGGSWFVVNKMSTQTVS